MSTHELEYDEEDTSQKPSVHILIPDHIIHECKQAESTKITPRLAIVPS